MCVYIIYIYKISSPLPPLYTFMIPDLRLENLVTKKRYNTTSRVLLRARVMEQIKSCKKSWNLLWERCSFRESERNVE